MPSQRALELPHCLQICLLTFNRSPILFQYFLWTLYFWILFCLSFFLIASLYNLSLCFMDFCTYSFPTISVLFFSLHRKMKFSIKDLFSKCNQIRKKVQICSHLLQKSLLGKFIFLCSDPLF